MLYDVYYVSHSMKPSGEFLKGCTETMVLSLLAERRMYGYELVSEIQARSRGVFELAQGTVYPLLYTLERKGLVRAVWETPGAEGGRRRKYYLLTEPGRKAVDEHLAQWSHLVKGMNLILGGK